MGRDEKAVFAVVESHAILCSGMVVYLEVDLFTGMTELTELSTMNCLRTFKGFTICQLS